MADDIQTYQDDTESKTRLLPNEEEDDQPQKQESLLATVKKFNKRQWLTVIVFSIVQFCQAICVSLQAPFYPAEAERKGASPTEYGLVFGIFELTVFIVSPFMGESNKTFFFHLLQFFFST